MSRMRSTGQRQRGVATIEYALLVALISLAVVMGLSLFGVSVSTEFGVVADGVASLFDGRSSGSGGAAGGAQGSRGNGHGAGNGGQNNGNGNGGQDNGTGNGK